MRLRETGNQKTNALLMIAGGAAVIVVPLLPRTRPFAESFAVLGLFFTAAFMLTHLFARRPARFFIFLVITFVFTFTLEAAGTATGLVFGSYRYGDALGPQLLGVPLVIGLNWCLITLACIRLSLVLLRPFGRPGRQLTLLTAPLGCVLFDVFLEPHAGHLDYWQWLDGAPPLQNYIGWGVVAFLVTGFYLLFVDRPADSIYVANEEEEEKEAEEKG